MAKIKCVHGKDRDTCDQCDNDAERPSSNGKKNKQPQDPDE